MVVRLTAFFFFGSVSRSAIPHMIQGEHWLLFLLLLGCCCSIGDSYVILSRYVVPKAGESRLAAEPLLVEGTRRLPRNKNNVAINSPLARDDGQFKANISRLMKPKISCLVLKRLFADEAIYMAVLEALRDFKLRQGHLFLPLNYTVPISPMR